MGLHGKVLHRGGVAGVAPVSSCQKPPPCLTEPMAAGSRTDLQREFEGAGSVQPREEMTETGPQQCLGVSEGGI